jgi:hypothetical protein
MPCGAGSSFVTAARRRLIGALLLAAAATAAGEPRCGPDAPLDASVRLDFAVTASRAPLSLDGEARLVYRRHGNGYTIESTLQARGLFEAQQTSAGSVGAHGLVPESFTQRNSRRPPRSVSFDWPGKRVAFGASGESEPTQPQLQDRLSVLMQLAWRHQRAPGAGRIELPVAGQRRISAYAFNAQAAEAVTVPAGRYEAVKFERHKEDGGESLEVWLAPALCALPVRLRYTDDRGLLIDQQLRAMREG